MCLTVLITDNMSTLNNCSWSSGGLSTCTTSCCYSYSPPLIPALPFVWLFWQWNSCIFPQSCYTWHIHSSCNCWCEGRWPFLTTGDISLAIMMNFETAAQDFFVTKSMHMDEHVAMVIPGLKDTRIHNWLQPTINVFHLLTLWRNFVPITCIKTGRTKYTRISWLQPLPVPIWPFGAGFSISSSLTACYEVHHPFLTRQCSATSDQHG